MISPKSAQANKYSFQKVFGDGNFFAAGQLIIPPGEEKPPKPAKDNSYVCLSLAILFGILTLKVVDFLRD